MADKTLEELDKIEARLIATRDRLPEVHPYRSVIFRLLSTVGTMRSVAASRLSSTSTTNSPTELRRSQPGDER